MGNIQRDARAIRELRRQGWKVLIVWECQLRNERTVEKGVLRFLNR
jgi:DNA mismatch endonuclease (patch repair protein)